MAIHQKHRSEYGAREGGRTMNVAKENQNGGPQHDECACKTSSPALRASTQTARAPSNPHPATEVPAARKLAKDSADKIQ